MNELKSHSLTFIDPYRNYMHDKFLDHKLIKTIIIKYMTDYVPKYLQQWIGIGKNIISPLNYFQLKSVEADYANDCKFFTFDEVTV